MTIKIIAALSKNRVIGHNGEIPWFIKGELKRFKEITQSHNVVMGRKTFDSIGHVLESRNNIIISKNESLNIDRATVVTSFEDALKACDQSKDVFIIGGSRIYEIAMKYSEYLLLTIIEQKFVGDVYFPKFDPSKWRLISEIRNYDNINKFTYTYLIYKS